METFDEIIAEIASVVRRLDELHGAVCTLASHAVKMSDETERERRLNDLNLLHDCLRSALKHLSTGTTKTSFFVPCEK